MFRLTLPLFLATAVAAGCASPPRAAPAPYKAPVAKPDNNLRDYSLLVAKGMAAETQAALLGSNEAVVIAKTQQRLADGLKDPGSAQFRNVSIKPYLDGRVVCGEVNAKNSYGGYVGFKRFIASPLRSETESKGGRYADIDAQANAGLWAACGG